MAKRSRNPFIPDTRKLAVFVALSILLWFFPVVTSSVYAAPFVNIESFWLGLFINLVVAYVVGCLLVAFWQKKLIILVAVALLFVAVPKVSFYSVGDIGGASENYCTCLGYEWGPTLQCCYSSVSYCQGICVRAERTRYWDGQEVSEGVSPERGACKAQGGVWEETYAGSGLCLMPTIDGNTSCTDASECEGLCVGYPRAGRCAEWNPLPRGCYDVLNNNTVSRLCMD